ncbi:MAG TPA: acyl-CoA dehydrogenase family protein [Iamia sp.]|nr:acyl-CoA dehydrogenase family protein [Iamia sp.]
MATYRAPVAAIAGALDAAGLASMLRWPAYAEIERQDVTDVLAEVGRFAEEVWLPSDRIGDQQPPRLDPDSGAVTTPAEIRRAYRGFVEAGWAALAMPGAAGGGGFPALVGLAAEELLDSANLGLSLCPMLTHGAVHLLERWGSAEQRAAYLPHLVSGEWTGTMCMTEPEAGSDVGAVRTRAVPGDDGTWSLTGTKIFITWGDHDLADGIVHLVLARTPGAPAGTKGISLFLVRRDRSGAGLPSDGLRANGVRVVGLERKLGLHASPTCVLELDGAVGELVGAVGGGMAGMFTMMNAARLSIGLQGLAVAERGYQAAVAHARDRVQGGVPIGEHPDVRRMLLDMASGIDAMRALLYETAAAADVARHHPDAERRRLGQSRADLLTPLAKAWPTDEGVRLTSVAIQVHGGMGYVEETGVAQHWRDSRIGPIYEGTNGIQAIDLVERKVRRDGGIAMAALLHDIDDTARALGALEGFDDAAHEVDQAIGAVRTATEHLLAADAVEDRRAVATPYLELTATTVAAALLARQILVPGHRRDAALARRVRLFALDRLPVARALVPRILRGVVGIDDRVRDEPLPPRGSIRTMAEATSQGA